MLLITAICLVLSAPQAALGPAAQVARVQAAYHNGGDMAATFKQTYTDSLRGKSRSESGKLWVKKDGRVRWSYMLPERKDFIFDGKTAYFYEPENAQVTVFDRFVDSPLANAMQFLWGQGELTESFDIRPCDAQCPVMGPGESAVLLMPKEHVTAVQYVVLVMDAQALRVRRSLVFDPLGNRTEYAFSEVTLGGNIAADKFQFTVPPGVSLLRNTADGAGPPPSLPQKAAP